jgi:hypothetical protein
MRFLLTLLAVGTLAAADPQMVLDLTLVEGSGDKPMIVVWVEKKDGTFVRTLYLFSGDKEYYKEMLVWSAAREGTSESMDAVTGASPAWAAHQLVKVPAGDLLAGDLVLRVEQRKDKGGHFKKRKVPITPDWPGVTISEHYIKDLIISVER